MSAHLRKLKLIYMSHLKYSDSFYIIALRIMNKEKNTYLEFMLEYKNKGEIYMIHRMKLNESPFERIKNGTKTIEFRLYDEKRQQIKVGDKIEFSKLPDLQEKLLVDVIKLYREDSFENLFRKLYKDEDEIKRKTKSMYKYYSPEKEKEYGVLGIEIKLIKII